MTCVLSWNIQNGKGVDNVISLDRIAEVIRSMGTPDVICLQEVSRHQRLREDLPASDQVAEIATRFPEYRAIFGPAVQTGEWAFGNLSLTRLPILSTVCHALPQPPAPGRRHMQRQAIELNVHAETGPLRVVNTHLEFHSASQRLAQVLRLRQIHQEIAANRLSPPAYPANGPYSDIGRAQDCLICGDFNMEVDSPEYGAMLSEPIAQEPRFHDAWRLIHPESPHAPTCGIFDHDQWPMGAHCRDYFFLTDGLRRSLGRLVVDTSTNASDHQPLMLEF